MDFIGSCKGRWQRNEVAESKDGEVGFDTKTHRRVGSPRCTRYKVHNAGVKFYALWPSVNVHTPSLSLQPAAVTLCVDPGAVFTSFSCIPCCLVPPAPSMPCSRFALHCALASLSYHNTLSFLSCFSSSLYFLVPNCLMLRSAVLSPENCTMKGVSFSSVKKKRIVLRLTCWYTDFHQGREGVKPGVYQWLNGEGHESELFKLENDEIVVRPIIIRPSHGSQPRNQYI